ncbi:hypothetical protein N7468_006389 [Penicillium chermesinum]|uniref:Uncharacterized protein n=1 Tax=Penicillium chermesinum TaxID=63820 RepID=A0A9W9NS97_9EURO|nr:uncharacterized protein N7468_006389 [Penicillium chermesinum]KAJ5225164.1 hypothetical protein N7468_006389 [Penicillium chermesinum]KAJ6140478.1 hypothetical protein N7470_010274 [Penicillium chermesinum]
MGRISEIRDVESHEGQTRSVWRDWASIVIGSTVGYMCLILIIVGYFHPSLLPVNPVALLFNKEVSPFFAFSQGAGYFPKPDGFQIIALVPFTYFERTEILDCYLRRNLVQNHGFLDKVVFIPQTDDKASLEWLYSIVSRTEEYAIAPSGHEMDWKIAHGDNMYIRIDGDTVFMEDHTIPTIVKTKLDNPDTLMVSANVINEGALAALHSHPGVALPYLPELYHVEQPSRSKSQLRHDWRASSLPTWEGPASFRVRKGFQPPFEGHRWLLPAEPRSDRDPISASIYTQLGPNMTDWTVAAQQHYSFLRHLESKDLARYKFPLWVDPAEPTSKNFGCFWGKDAGVLRRIFEHELGSEELLRSWTDADGNKPRITIDGKGLASHYSASQGASGLDATDLVDRYRAYAQERVCRDTR